jgi:recombination protein RecR
LLVVPKPGKPAMESKAAPSDALGLRRNVAYPRAVDTLIEQFAELPGIGRRSAERLAFHVLKSDASQALALANAVRDVKATVRHCKFCWHLADAAAAHGEGGGERTEAGVVCGVCADASRDRGSVLVVEQPKDLIALEATGMYKGLYHVLMGRLSPLEGVGPQDLTIAGLRERIRQPAEHQPMGVVVREVILGLNPTMEGDGTALYLMEVLQGTGVAMSRLARGLPSGSSLEYASKAVLADALHGRRSL